MADLGRAHARWRREADRAVDAGRALLGDARHAPHLDGLGGGGRIERAVDRLERAAVLDHLPQRIVAEWEKLEDRVRETGTHRYFLPEHGRLCEAMDRVYPRDEVAHRFVNEDLDLRKRMTRQAERLDIAAKELGECVEERRSAEARNLPFVRQEGQGHQCLVRHSAGRGAAQADIIRLLLLTGCRKNEIVRLRWSEVRDDMLTLADSKTGPRTVPLNARARSILHSRPRGESPFVFPSLCDPSRPRGHNLGLWYRVRREAGIEDARLHDLRHSHASHAVMNGVSVPVVARLVGHSNTRMTLRYAHLGDRDIERAAERVGHAVAHLMNGPDGS